MTTPDDIRDEEALEESRRDARSGLPRATAPVASPFKYTSEPLCSYCDVERRTTIAMLGEPPAPCAKCGQSTRRVFVTRMVNS